MMRAIVLIQVVMMFFCVSPINALSLDFSALRSGENKQLQAQVKHVRTSTTSRLEIGGKFAKVEGRNETYEAYIAQSSSIWKAVVVESDVRRYHSHDTFALGTGLGYKGFSATGGARVEYKSTRSTLARGTLKYVRKWKWINLTGSLEGLSDGKNERLDHKFGVKVPHKYIYIALRTERVRSVSTDGISFGVVF
jgi:hypothetical protein